MATSLLPGRFTLTGVSSTLVILATAAAVNFDGSSYARNASLNANMDVFWNIDTELETVRVAVHAKAATGWAGFGVSEMGGMEGADIVFYEVSTDSVTDAHAIEAGRPVKDECTQDWTLVSADVDADSLVFVAERALNTGDAQDHAFVDDSADGAMPTRILTAWGDEDTVTYHGANFAKGQIILYGGVENSGFHLIAEATSAPGVSYFDVRAHNFTIPATRTTYAYTCFPASELPAIDEYHAIGFASVVSNATTNHVHHLVLRAFTIDHCAAVCIDDDATTTTGICDRANFEDIFVWAPGSSDFALPDDVGFLLGNESGRFVSLELDVHYNNPDEVEGLIDDSGVRVYYTEQLRAMNMGVLQLGDPYVELAGVALPEGKSSQSFGCPSSCFEDNFQDDTVTVFAHGLHMHENGQRLETRQYRNNSDGQEVLVHSVEVEYYSYLQAGLHVVSVDSSATIQKGDRFETTCYYDTALSSMNSDNVTFGYASDNEMCIHFIWYYPDQDVRYSGVCGPDDCGGSMDELQVLTADSDFGRTFGVADACSSTADEPNSSSSSSIPGLMPLTLTVATAVALFSAPLIANFGKQKAIVSGS